MKKIINYKSKSLILIVLGLFLILPFLGLDMVRAQDGTDNGVSKLANPIEGEININATIKRVVNTALGILGSVTLLVFVIGGFMWLTSGGNEQRVEKGTKTMLYATIGVFVIFSAYAILNALIGVLSGS